MSIDFSASLPRWYLVDAPDCDTCGNEGFIEVQAASFVVPIPCPECPRSDWHAHDAALGWAEQ